MGISAAVELGETVVDQGLVEHNSEALKVIATMTGNARASFHLEYAKALHNLVMTKLSKLASISNDSALLTMSANNDIVCFVLGYRNISVYDVSNLAEQLFTLLRDFLPFGFLCLDAFLQGLGLSLLSRCVGFLVSLLLGSNCLGNVSLLLSETIKLIFGYNLQRRQWLENNCAESKTLQILIFAGNNQLTCSLLTIKFNDLINDCLVIKSCTLGSLHSLGITTYQMYD